MTFVLAIAFFSAGVLSSWFCLRQALIDIRFFIPFTRLLRNATLLNKRSCDGIIINACLRPLVEVGIFIAASVGVQHFFPRFVVSFALGAASNVLVGWSKTGFTAANAARYLSWHGHLLSDMDVRYLHDIVAHVAAEAGSR